MGGRGGYSVLAAGFTGVILGDMLFVVVFFAAAGFGAAIFFFAGVFAVFLGAAGFCAVFTAAFFGVVFAGFLPADAAPPFFIVPPCCEQTQYTMFLNKKPQFFNFFQFFAGVVYILPENNRLFHLHVSGPA